MSLFAKLSSYDDRSARLAGIGLMLLMATLSWLIARDVLGALDRQKTRMQDIAEGAIDKPVEETG
ncbi:hypothetical protein ACI4CV_28000, partial [Klebsiella pneumoniae]|uniref:hypothetical protein n=1 Tax=Klebsiella pneumoniae TaxID=573 RepID=UPI0038541B8C